MSLHNHEWFQQIVTRASLPPLSWRLGFEERPAHTGERWSDSLPMIHARRPIVANLLVRHMEGDSWSPLRAASQAATELDGLQGSRCHMVGCGRWFAASRPRS